MTDRIVAIRALEDGRQARAIVVIQAHIAEVFTIRHKDDDLQRVALGIVEGTVAEFDRHHARIDIFIQDRAELRIQQCTAPLHPGIGRGGADCRQIVDVVVQVVDIVIGQTHDVHRRGRAPDVARGRAPAGCRILRREGGQRAIGIRPAGRRHFQRARDPGRRIDRCRHVHAVDIGRRGQARNMGHVILGAQRCAKVHLPVIGHDPDGDLVVVIGQNRADEVLRRRLQRGQLSPGHGAGHVQHKDDLDIRRALFGDRAALHINHIHARGMHEQRLHRDLPLHLDRPLPGAVGDDDLGQIGQQPLAIDAVVDHDRGVQRLAQGGGVQRAAVQRLGQCRAAILRPHQIDGHAAHQKEGGEEEKPEDEQRALFVAAETPERANKEGQGEVTHGWRSQDRCTAGRSPAIPHVLAPGRGRCGKRRGPARVACRARTLPQGE